MNIELRLTQRERDVIDGISVVTLIGANSANIVLGRLDAVS
jgi:hypothetical protein